MNYARLGQNDLGPDETNEAVGLSDIAIDGAPPPMATEIANVQPGDWSCKRCTLVNPRAVAVCTACRCPKPGTSAAPSPTPSAPPPASSVPLVSKGPQYNPAPYAGGDGSRSAASAAGGGGRSNNNRQFGNSSYVLPFAEAERSQPFSGGRGAATTGGGRATESHPAPAIRRQAPTSSMFGGMFGPTRQQMADAGPQDEEEMKKEQCAQMGCMCSVCCPVAGCATYMVNRDAAEGSRRQKLAKMAVGIALIMVVLQLVMLYAS